MQVISVNVGVPREVVWRGKTVLTGIFKQPVPGRIKLRSLNLEGDRQADLSVHGGLYKAIYAYPSEHYPYWRNELAGMELPWGMFGENLTIAGLLEDAIHIGDRLRVGTAELRVTQPRTPCYKLEIKFGRADMVQRFLASQRSGFYFAVVQEGDVAAGDSIEIIDRDPDQITVADIVRLRQGELHDLDLLQRAVQLQALPSNLRDQLKKRLD